MKAGDGKRKEGRRSMSGGEREAKDGRKGEVWVKERGIV